MSKSKKKVAWFLMECDEDKSLSIVPKRDVMCTGTVNVEDMLKFKFPDASGKSRWFEGTVKDLGPEEDYDRLMKVQSDLNKKKKSHVNNESPNGAVRSSRRHTSASQTVSSPIIAGPSVNVNEGLGKKPRNKATPAIIDSDTDYENAHSSAESDDSELTPEEQILLMKAQEKEKKKQAKKLRGLSERSNSPKLGDGKRDSSSNDLPVKKLGEANGDKVDAHYDLSDSELDNSMQKESPISTMSAFRRKRKPDFSMEFEGQMYLFDKTSTGAVELYPGVGVYLSSKSFITIKASASSAGGMARQLMKAIFTEDALKTCSLGGNTAFGTGKTSAEEVRPGLDSNGVDAIFNYTKARMKKKVEQRNWKEVDDGTIKARMRNVLCEHRPRVVKTAKVDGAAAKED